MKRCQFVRHCDECYDDEHCDVDDDDETVDCCRPVMVLYLSVLQFQRLLLFLMSSWTSCLMKPFVMMVYHLDSAAAAVAVDKNWRKASDFDLQTRQKVLQRDRFTMRGGEGRMDE